MFSEKATIKVECLFSDNRQHRYLMTKIWDKAKSKASVISIAPSLDCNVRSDLTTMLITNNLFSLDFGGFDLLNLYSRIGINLKTTTNFADAYDQNTNDVILDSVSKSDVTILAWGRITKKLVKSKEEEILKLLEPHKSKLKVIADLQNREGLHPLTPAVRSNFLLRDYVKE